MFFFNPLTAADDILIFFLFFRENKVDIICELSARKKIHMNGQTLFALTNYEKKGCRLLHFYLAFYGLNIARLVIYSSQLYLIQLTLVLLNPDMLCICE